MTIKAILFDKDGTLLDFEKTYGPATSKVIHHLAGADHKLADDMASLVHFDFETSGFSPQSIIIAGNGHDIAGQWVTVNPSWNQDELAHRIDALYELYSPDCVVPFEGLADLLGTLQDNGFSLGIATNDTEKNARSHLEKMKISPYFDFVAGYDSGYGPKPQPGMVLAFAKHSSFAPGEIMMVGDSLHDMHTGKNAGALCVAVTTGMACAEELSPHADHVLDNLAGLPGLLRELDA